MQDRFYKLFGTKKPIIAMVHLGALPGSPLYNKESGITGLIKEAKKDLEALQTAKFDAIMFGNENDRPYQLTVDTASTAAAAYFRARKDNSIISPSKNLSFSENFFKMMFNKVPDKEIVRAFDFSLFLYADHSFNVSTFTARTITSSLSDLHGAITGAIASLKGPLHGGANEAVMHMMKEIKKPEKAKGWIENALDKKKVIMGFGHRVYRTGDSRVPTMKHYMFKVAKLLKKEKYTQIYEILEKVMNN